MNTLILIVLCLKLNSIIAKKIVTAQKNKQISLFMASIREFLIDHYIDAYDH